MKCLHRMRQIFRLPLHAYLLYLLVATFLFTGVTFSSYVTTASGGDSARVAAGVLSVSSDSSDITLEAGNDTTYTFTVSNTRNGQCSEVAVQYDVTVTLKEPLPAGVSLQLDNGLAYNNNSTEYTFDDVAILPTGTATGSKHTLTFSTDSDLSLTEEVTNTVTVTVHAEQID